MKTKPLYTINFHLLKQCNLSCSFCFAPFNYLESAKPLSLEEMCKLVTLLKEAGAKKLNLAGGEPLILADICGKLMKFASEIGLKTSIVTNGTFLTAEWLEQYGRYLDWIAFSCDSATESIQKSLGRGNGNHVETTRRAFRLVKEFNAKNPQHKIRTKLNSVITRLNHHEEMTDFVLECQPDRWKILQILEIEGENDATFQDLSITKEQFDSFVERNRIVEQKGVVVVSEDNELMTESYVMVDPAGQFFQNKGNQYQVSQPILEIGVQKALEQISFSKEKFLERGGLYDY